MFVTTYHTDVGIKKKINQDGLLIKLAKSSIGDVGLFAICDGMGGLSNGEVASSTLIIELSKWFENELPNLTIKNNLHNVKEELLKLIKCVNNKIVYYGREKGLKLGTTISALLIVEDKYYIFHIGDSRIYKIDGSLKQLTKDQTFVAREIELGRMTQEDAENHPRKSVLLECIGVKPAINILTYEGTVNNSDVFLLCSDGFYHKVKEEELIQGLYSSNHTVKEEYIREKCIEFVELAKTRKETDNISVIVLYREG